jgi:hypothetical protein
MSFLKSGAIENTRPETRKKKGAERKNRLPTPIDQQFGNVSGQILGQQRKSLPFGAAQIITHSDQSETADRSIQENLSCAAVTRGDLGSQSHSIIAHGQDVIGSKTNLVTRIASNDPANDDVAILLRSQPERPIPLEFLPDLSGDSVGQTWFHRAVNERVHLDGLFPRCQSIRGSQFVAGTAGKNEAANHHWKNSPFTCLSSLF